MKAPKRKAGSKAKLFVILLTLINSLIVLATRIYDRKEVIKIVENDDKIQALVLEKSKTLKL